MKISNDTICAISTPHGTGGIAVARISGPDAIAITDKIARKRTNPHRAPWRNNRYKRRSTRPRSGHNLSLTKIIYHGRHRGNKRTRIHMDPTRTHQYPRQSRCSNCRTGRIYTASFRSRTLRPRRSRSRCRFNIIIIESSTPNSNESDARQCIAPPRNLAQLPD